MDQSKILERWKGLDAQRAQKSKAKLESTTLDENGDSSPSTDTSPSVSDSTVETSAQRSTGPWTMVSEKPSTTPSTRNGGSGVQVWGPEPPSPVVNDIFNLIAELEQQPGRNQDAFNNAESHAYAMEMELQNCRTAQELDSKRIRELEERLRAAEEQFEVQKRAIDTLREENVSQDCRIVDLEQRIRDSYTAQSASTGTEAEEKKPSCPHTVKKKVSSLFRRGGKDCQSDKR